MRAVIQRVLSASVTVDARVVGQIGRGLLVLLGAEDGDTPADVEFMTKKISTLRIFPDEEGRMNLDVTEAGGAILAVSQFTLLGDCRKGRRPSFAGRPSRGSPTALRGIYDQTRALGLRVETGIFQADMQVELVNDGPSLC